MAGTSTELRCHISYHIVVIFSWQVRVQSWDVIFSYSYHIVVVFSWQVRVQSWDVIFSYSYHIVVIFHGRYEYRVEMSYFHIHIILLSFFMAGTSTELRYHIFIFISYCHFFMAGTSTGLRWFTRALGTPLVTSCGSSPRTSKWGSAGATTGSSGSTSWLGKATSTLKQILLFSGELTLYALTGRIRPLLPKFH